MKPLNPIRFAASALLLTALFSARPAAAMTNFARKYGFDCSMCHTSIPRLNRFGYNFLMAGFRLPSEIGQTQKMTMDNAFAARIELLYEYARNTTAMGAPGAFTTTTDTNSQLTLDHIGVNVLTGSFGKYYGSMTELSYSPDSSTEIEQAFIRFTRGDENNFGSVRVGIFHPFQGYGASDMAYSIDDPLIMMNSADNSGALNSSTGATLFAPTAFNQAGMEFSWVHGNASISATLFNGLATDGINMWAAAGGNSQKIAGQPTKNSKDFQVFFNQILKKDGSGVSAYYYNGHTTLPDDPAAPANAFKNDFYRAGLFASWKFIPQLELEGGYLTGQDHAWNTVNLDGSDIFKSKGWFGEIDSNIKDMIVIGARYDWFDPSDRVDHNAIKAYTAFVNAPFGDGMQLRGQYQHMDTQQFNLLPDMKDDSARILLVWIW